MRDYDMQEIRQALKETGNIGTSHFCAYTMRECDCESVDIWKVGRVYLSSEIIEQLYDDNEIIKCDICDEWTESVLISEFDDEIYCQHCWQIALDNRDIIECDYCGELIRWDDAYSVHDSYNHHKYACQHCLNNDDSIYYCFECGTYTDADFYDSRHECCLECAENNHTGRDRRLAYHDGHELERVFWKRPYNDDSNMFFGLELETTRKNENDDWAVDDLCSDLYEILGEHAYYESDSSIGCAGVEIVTEPHTKKALIDLVNNRTLKRAIDTLKRYDYVSHDSGLCGLHIHATRREITRDGLKSLIYFFEKNRDELTRFARRTDEQIDDWCDFYTAPNTSDNELKLYIDDLINGDIYANRYHAINIDNDYTIECRLLRGTLNFETLCASVDVITCLFENCSHVPLYSLDFDAWFVGISDSTKKYLRDKNFFGFGN